MAEVNESPQVEEPKQPQEAKETPKQEAKSEYDELLNELRRVGVEKPEQIQGMFQASQQTGRAWNEVGELRKEVDRLTTALRDTPQKPYEPDSYGDSQPIDLQRALREGIRAEIGEMQKAQQQSLQRYYGDLAEIQSDEDYGVVGELFEKHINTPNVAMRIQSGQTTLDKEYSKVNRTYYRQLVKRTTSVLEKQAGVKQRPPHMESSDSHSVVMPTTDDESQEVKKRIVKNRQSGALTSDQALEALIKNALPDDDPIWRT